MPKRSSEFKGALTGGAVVFVGLLGGVILVGSVGNFQALRLIEATLPTARFLAGSAIGAGITVLALMLTLIGITSTSELTFADLLFRRIRNINFLAIAVIVVSVAVLVALAIPIEEVDELDSYYAFLYYTLAAMVSLLGGLVVATSLMIGGTVKGMVEAARPEGNSSLVIDESDSSQT
ncbi:MAG: hypothetical protein WDZ96_08250 [Acidimicrobiia bacterium]